ncbi:MAG TPA: sigma factor, partial [Chloroflexia bacterium]|nr:sigma factor [Chloroflexia bacterium]
MSSTADEFEAQRPLLFAIAYRLLGSAVEAEDIVQETYLRYSAVPAVTIGSPRALL